MGECMSKLDEFKLFIKDKSHLYDYVQRGEMSWQKYYELWSLYGEHPDIWKKYKPKEEIIPTDNTTVVSDLVSMVKSINLDQIKDAVKAVGNAITLFQDLTSKNNVPLKEGKTPYEPRAIYRKFED